MDAGEFLVPSPETLTSEDEQPSSAQKHPLITCHEKVSDDNLISFREKGRATLKPAQLDMNDTDNDSESEVEESSSDSSEEDEGGHAQLPEESSTSFLLVFISSMHSLRNSQMLITIYCRLLAISVATIWGSGRKSTFIAQKKVCHKSQYLEFS